MASYQGGSVCAYRGCISKARNRTTSLFRFPRDVDRARDWLIACNREDLLGKSPQALHGHFHLCELHFESNMFSTKAKLKKRLITRAVPTIFPHHSKQKSCDVLKEEAVKHVKVSDENRSAADTSRSASPSTEDSQPTDTPELVPSTKLPRPSNALPSDILSKSELENEIGVLRNENLQLKRRLKEYERRLERNKEQQIQDITLDDYMTLTFKFCGNNVDLANFINVQVSEIQEG